MVLDCEPESAFELEFVPYLTINFFVRASKEIISASNSTFTTSACPVLPPHTSE